MQNKSAALFAVVRDLTRLTGFKISGYDSLIFNLTDRNNKALN